MASKQESESLKASKVVSPSPKRQLSQSYDAASQPQMLIAVNEINLPKLQCWDKAAEVSSLENAQIYIDY